MTGEVQAHPVSVSLIVVSRGRPEHLRLLMSALRHQTLHEFELVVVSDLVDLPGYPGANSARHIHFDEPNISAARNLGIAAANGEVIAFCDDDAIPDPTWLAHLTAPFQDAKVGISGGYTRGRNGIDYQWKAVDCDNNGDDRPVALSGWETIIRQPSEGYFPRAHGTNCAFRADALCQVGGFDEGFHFFLDETDVCLRLGQQGWATAVVPRAQVHHGFAASDQRTTSRAPKSLFEVGASKALFLRKHGQANAKESRNRLLKDRKRQLISLMVEGRIEPRDVSFLLKTLEDGLNSTRQSQLSNTPRISQKPYLTTFETHKSDSVDAFGSSLLRSREVQKMAEKLAKEGKTAFVFRFSFTSLFHHRFYHPSGFWMQTGGLFGKSVREERVIRVSTIHGRLRQEMESMHETFPFKTVTGVGFRRTNVII
ncbi:MAG: glycosyltransferase [Pseudomonadota bacterium]